MKQPLLKEAKEGPAGRWRMAGGPSPGPLSTAALSLPLAYLGRVSLVWTLGGGHNGALLLRIPQHTEGKEGI